MRTTFIQLASNIPAAIAGGGLFIVSVFVLQFDIPLALLVSVAGYFVTGLLIFPAKSESERPREFMLEQTLKDGKRKIAEIRKLSSQIKPALMRQKIEAMCAIGGNIFDAVRKNPENVRAARQFVDYYLETTHAIMQKYIELSAHRTYSTEVQHSLHNVEGMLDTLQGAFEKQLSAILKEKMLDLDSDLAILQETIDIEKL